MNQITRLLSPSSVAVIGASGDARKTSGRPIAFLRKHGFQGRLYPVNPRYEEIDGMRCYASVAELPEVPDVALILLAPERANQAVAELAARGCAAAIVLAGGYGETGEAGLQRQQELDAARGSMRILGPNTIGLVNLTERITLSASGALDMDELLAGRIAVVSQSGGILGALLSRGVSAGIGFSKLISTSNEVDLDVADFVDCLAEDPATSVIALYLEGLRDSEKFTHAALKARAAGKPIVVYKVGRSEAGAHAANSHTGALAGADNLYSAYFRQLGVIRAETFADLLDIPFALASGRVMRGQRVAILTSTGGAGTLIADNLGVAGFETPTPGAETAEKLRALDIGDQAVLDRNPIDLTLAGLQPELMRKAISILLDSPDFDAVISVVGSSGVAQPHLMADAIRDSLAGSDKPVLAYISPHAPSAAQRINGSGGVAFSAPESCASALSALAACAALQAEPFSPTAKSPSSAVFSEPLPAGQLDEERSKRLYASFGIPVTRERVVRDAEQAALAARELGGKVVLKVLSERIAHKSEVGGVALAVEAEVIGERLERMRDEVGGHVGFTPESFLVQEMVVGGQELILGFHRDPQLGPALLLGMGGVTAELFQDTTLRLLPVNREQSRQMLCELRTFPLLDGFRGRPKADLDAAIECIVAFSDMAMQLGDRLVEAEINPLLVRPAGRGVVALDGLTVIA
ncbi:acetate--CoA ligase family protein [Pseudomonas sp. 21LCFQ010]|uniref:acetate--CoA ligase family protein n=1 Tax=Pseudomonas sp. 21LCFQ010 TaxID=2957506 RepID=UPI0020970A77|nr:acetate--CoA ligase family protein [Pseudomonas sp. 21LCFQ010]MCO8164884.1 acetate--CoA ligase family protein [Pseudomonas sp. 21LCFQ010]